jgi:DNA-binding LacI/PurR family transcriptional regulator
VINSISLDPDQVLEAPLFSHDADCFPLRTGGRPGALPDRKTAGKCSPLRLIADSVGVSKMTVSRALREGTSVESELRIKIQNAARQLGYQPDPRLSQVMSAMRKSQGSRYRETLALIWTHRRREEKSSKSFFEEILAGADRRAQQLGYKLDEIHMMDEGLSSRALSHILHSRGIRGVLTAPPSAEGNHPPLCLDWKKFCCVLIGGSLAAAGLARVQPDHFYACVLAMQRLQGLHYKRIGLVLSQSMDEHTASQIRSVFLCAHPLGARKAEKLIFTLNPSNSKNLAKWLDQSNPEVIIANSEDAFSQLEQMGSAAQVDLVALSWNKDQPTVAGVNQQRALIGEQAVDVVLSRLERNLFGLDEGAPTMSIPGLWIDGASIRNIPAMAVA